jgi:hypothetical protein
MSDTEILKRAVFNIENYFKFVGVLERFDESLACMSRLIGFGKNLFYIKRNAFSDRGYVLSDKYMKIISERNRADEQLYKYVNARLDALRTAETERIMQTIHRNNIITMPLRIIYPLRNYFLSIGQARTFLSKCSAVLCLRHRAR